MLLGLQSPARPAAQRLAHNFQAFSSFATILPSTSKKLKYPNHITHKAGKLDMHECFHQKELILCRVSVNPKKNLILNVNALKQQKWGSTLDQTCGVIPPQDCYQAFTKLKLGIHLTMINQPEQDCKNSKSQGPLAENKTNQLGCYHYPTT